MSAEVPPAAAPVAPAPRRARTPRAQTSVKPAGRKRSRFLADTLADLYDRPEFQDFLGLCRKLEAEIDDKPRIGKSLTRRDEAVRFGQDPFFGHAASTIARATPGEDGTPSVFVRFLGLLGPHGAMPLGVTEEAMHYMLAKDESFARFLDLLNNRFIQLFFRAWADSRPVTHRDRPQDTDRFTAYLGAGIGLGAQAFRQQDGVDDLAKIAYAGLFGAKTRSVSRLKASLSQLFGVRVEIEEFIGQRLIFEPDQRSRLGVGFARLGQDVLLGAGVYSVQDKFRFRIFVDDLERFESFLPTGTRSKSFAEIVAFFLGLELQWDVELLLPSGQARGMTLGRSGRLGWTSWVAPNWTSETSQHRGDARFDLMERHLSTPNTPTTPRN